MDRFGCAVALDLCGEVNWCKFRLQLKLGARLFVLNYVPARIWYFEGFLRRRSGVGQV